jgi:hypothetical protein
MASFATVNKAVAGVVAESVFQAKKDVMEYFAKFLSEKIDFDEDMQAYFDEFKATLVLEKIEVLKEKSKKDGTGEKKKRAPSAYNLYIKDKMAEIKSSQPELKGKELMKAAIVAWNADKQTAE